MASHRSSSSRADRKTASAHRKPRSAASGRQGQPVAIAPTHEIAPLETVASLIEAGLTVAAIAARLGCCTATVNNRIRQGGLPRPDVSLSVRRGSSIKNYRHDVTVRAVKKLLAAGLTVKQVAQRLGTAATVVHARMREGGLPFPPKRKRPRQHPEPPLKRPVPRWSRVDHDRVNRVLKQVAPYYGNVERLRAAVEMLQREDPLRRVGYLVWGRWKRRVAAGRISLAYRHFVISVPEGTPVRIELNDGELHITGGGASVRHGLPREGLSFNRIRRGDYRDALGVVLVKLTGKGRMVHQQREYRVGEEHARSRVYAFFFPRRDDPIFVSLDGALLPTVREAPAPVRAAARRLGEAQLLQRRFDVERQARVAVRWLVDRWTADPAFFGTTGYSIAVAGIIPWEPVHPSIVRLVGCDEHGAKTAHLSFGMVEGYYPFVLQGRMLYMVDGDGRPFDCRELPHPFGFMSGITPSYRGDRLHRVLLRPCTLPRGHLLHVHLAWTHFELRLPDEFQQHATKRAAVLIEAPPVVAPTFTLLFEQGGKVTRTVLSVVGRGESATLKHARRKVDPALSSLLGEAVVLQWMDLMPSFLFDRIRSCLASVSDDRSTLARRGGRIGELAADAVIDAALALLHGATAALERSFDPARDLPHVVRALLLFAAAERMTACLTALADLFRRPSQRRLVTGERLSATRFSLHDAAARFHVGELTAGPSPQRTHGRFQLHLLDYRDPARPLRFPEGILLTKLAPRLAGLSTLPYGECIETLRQDPQLARRLRREDASAPPIDPSIWMTCSRRDLHLHIALQLDRVETTAAARWIQSHGAIQDVVADENAALLFDLGRRARELHPFLEQVTASMSLPAAR